MDRRINEWLKSVEEHIRATLAEKLAQSLESSKAFNVESPDRVKYLEWLDKYQVSIRTMFILCNIAEMYLCGLCMGFYNYKILLVHVHRSKLLI